MATFAWFVVAAIAEIAGCFAAWAVLRLDRSPWWLLAGAVALAVFAYALTRVDSDYAGRAYAAYGGVYIAAALLWLWAAEGRFPDRWDLSGAVLALAGTCVILWGPRS